MSGTFSASNISTEHSITSNLQPYDISNPIYIPDTNIKSGRITNNHVQGIPLKKEVPKSHVIAEALQEDSLPKDEYSNNQKQTKKTIQRYPPISVPTTKDQIYQAKTHENSKP